MEIFGDVSRNTTKIFEYYIENFQKKFRKVFENYYGEFRKVIGIRKFRGNLYVFRNFEETDICSKILRKFKGTEKKLLKQAILRKFFLYFENIFRNNCVKFQVNVRKITTVGNSQF